MMMNDNGRRLTITGRTGRLLCDLVFGRVNWIESASEIHRPTLAARTRCPHTAMPHIYYSIFFLLFKIHFILISFIECGVSTKATINFRLEKGHCAIHGTSMWLDVGFFCSPIVSQVNVQNLWAISSIGVEFFNYILRFASHDGRVYNSFCYSICGPTSGSRLCQYRHCEFYRCRTNSRVWIAKHTAVVSARLDSVEWIRRMRSSRSS